jgi:uncharacterized membrane protein YkoI
MTRSTFTVLLIALLTAAAALADDVSPERVRELVERGEILPLEQILKRNEASLGGRVIEIELERKRGTYIYEIKVLRPDGRTREIEIDARTGAIVPDDD